MNDISNWIAYVATVAAFLAAVHARHARDAAQHANRIAIFNMLRPDRLAVYLD